MAGKNSKKCIWSLKNLEETKIFRRPFLSTGSAQLTIFIYSERREIIFLLGVFVTTFLSGTWNDKFAA